MEANDDYLESIDTHNYEEQLASLIIKKVRKKSIFNNYLLFVSFKHLFG